MKTRAELAYLAGILDTNGSFAVRTTPEGSKLPQVSMSTSNERLLNWLGELTGVKAIPTKRTYQKTGCAIHCAQKHQHIVSVSGRWSVSGCKALVVLEAIKPYVWQQIDEVEMLIKVGRRAKFKPAVRDQMKELGWTIPRSMK